MELVEPVIAGEKLMNESILLGAGDADEVSAAVGRLLVGVVP